jgi:outer membrane protein assembly factor BamB
MPAAPAAGEFTWKSAPGRGGGAPVTAVWRTRLPGPAAALVSGRDVYVFGTDFVAARAASTGALRWSRSIDSAWYRQSVRDEVVTLAGLAPARADLYDTTVWELRLRASDGAVLSCRYLADYNEQGRPEGHVAGWSWQASGTRGVLVSSVVGRDFNGDDDSSTVVVTSMQTGGIVRERRLHGLWESLLVRGDRLWLARYAPPARGLGGGARSFTAVMDLRTGRLRRTGMLVPDIDLFGRSIYLVHGRPVVADGDAMYGMTARAFDLGRGQPLWRLRTTDAARALGGRYGSHPYFVVYSDLGRSVLARVSRVQRRRGEKVRLVSLSPTTGHVEWMAGKPFEDLGSVYPLGNVLLAHGDGAFTGLAPSSGRTLWTVPVPTGLDAEPSSAAVDRGILFVSGPRLGSLQLLDRRGYVGGTAGLGLRHQKDDGEEPGLTVAGRLVAVSDRSLLVVYRRR